MDLFVFGPNSPPPAHKFCFVNRKSLKCSDLYLSQFRETSPHLLASGDGTNKKPMIVGDVYIHPSVKLHPTAKVNPFSWNLIKHLSCKQNLELSLELDWSKRVNLSKRSCWAWCKAYKLHNLGRCWNQGNVTEFVMFSYSWQ